MKPKCKICGYVHLPDHAETFVVGADGLCPMCHDLTAGNDNYDKPRTEYLARLQAMTDAELRDETEHMIWLSAYAANNPRSDYHWQCDLTYKIWMGRNKIDEYSRAHKAVMAQCGY